MNRFVPVGRLAPAVLIAVPLLLGACSQHLTDALAARIMPTAQPVNHDEVAAAKPDAARQRKLFLILVDALRKSGKCRAALAYLDDYDRVYPGDDRARIMRGQCDVDTGDVAAAGPVFRSQLGSDFAAEAQAGLGEVAAAGGDWAAAIPAFHRAALLQPANPKFLNDVGFAQLAAGQPAAAVDALRAAHELDSASVTVRNNLILALHLSGQDGAARDLISTITPEAAAQQAAALLQVTAGQVGAAPAAVSAAGAGAPPAMTAAIVPASREALR